MTQIFVFRGCTVAIWRVFSSKMPPTISKNRVSINLHQEELNKLVSTDLTCWLMLLSQCKNPKTITPLGKNKYSATSRVWSNVARNLIWKCLYKIYQPVQILNPKRFGLKGQSNESAFDNENLVERIYHWIDGIRLFCMFYNLTTF